MWPPPWDGARTVRIPAVLLFLALPLPGQGAWWTVPGRRVPLTKEEMRRTASLVRSWILSPSGGPGTPSSKGAGLEGALARRVRPGKTHFDPGAGARTYPLQVEVFPGAGKKTLRKPGVLELFSSSGGKGWLVSFQQVPLPRGKGRIMVWRARLAEGLSFRGLGGRRCLLLDGDGDGYFQTYGKDLLLLKEEKPGDLLPLTAVALFQTGAYDLSVDREGRVSWRAHQGPMGLLEVRAVLAGNGRLRSVVVGTGKVFRKVSRAAPVVPVTPGRWFLYWGKITGGFSLIVPYPDRSAPQKGRRKLVPPRTLPSKSPSPGVLVAANRKQVLSFGAPFHLDFSARDRGNRVVLENLRVEGSRGGIYHPDPETFGKGDVPLLMVTPIVGKAGRRRRRSPLPWVPWVPGGKGIVRRQKMVLSVGENWAPLYFGLSARRGPFAGARGFVRVR